MAVLAPLPHGSKKLLLLAMAASGKWQTERGEGCTQEQWQGQATQNNEQLMRKSKTEQNGLPVDEATPSDVLLAKSSNETRHGLTTRPRRGRRGKRLG
jgi:hypothetical protein